VLRSTRFQLGEGIGIHNSHKVVPHSNSKFTSSYFYLT
jgi:hypothetical protein